MTVVINGTTGITSPEMAVDNGAADGGQVVLKSSGFNNWNIDNYSGNCRFYYNATELMRIDSSGNVGIGTSSPAAKLDVKVTGAARLLIGYGGGSTNYTDADTQIFRAGNATERMRLDSSGNLLVGTTITLWGGERLAVNGASGAIGQTIYANGAGSIGLLLYSSIATGATAGKQISFVRNDGVEVGSITSNGSSTNYNTSSDYRLKENIQPMTGALAKVAALKPCTYKWKVDGSDGEGFIAHELAEVVPQCVTGEKDAVEIVEIKDEDGNVIGTEERPIYQGIDTSFLVATLTAAIKEQQAIIAQQSLAITQLQADVAALKGNA